VQYSVISRSQIKGETLCSDIHKFTHSVQNKEELRPCKKDTKSNFYNSGGIQLLLIPYNILYKILMVKLNPKAENKVANN
jgi:hypothetical protein